MSSKRAINAMITRWGESVIVMPRTVNTDSETGAPDFTYPEHTWFYTKCLVYDASGLREEWYVIGKAGEVDYIASFSESLRDKINPLDRIKLLDGTLTIVENVIERGRGPSKDFLELLLNKVD